MFCQISPCKLFIFLHYDIKPKPCAFCFTSSFIPCITFVFRPARCMSWQRKIKYFFAFSNPFLIFIQFSFLCSINAFNFFSCCLPMAACGSIALGCNPNDYTCICGHTLLVILLFASRTSYYMCYLLHWGTAISSQSRKLSAITLSLLSLMIFTAPPSPIVK